jgi:hypothetical protein
MKFENYTIENLVNDCPKSDKVDMNKIKEMLENIFEHCDYYQDVNEYFKKYVNTCFPGSDYNKYKWDSPEYDEYYNYMMGDIDNKETSFYKWSKWVAEDFLCVKGPRRTFDEACKLAADEWCKKLFGNHFQDNGALNEEHSFIMCGLGTLLKDKANESITSEMIENTRKNLYKYFENHCEYRSKEHPEWIHHIQLYSDYGPNSPLYDILYESGIPENEIRSICPWKTGIEIDENDNAVIIVGYQKRDYI